MKLMVIESSPDSAVRLQVKPRHLPVHPQKRKQRPGLEGKPYKELRLLEEVHRTPEVSQRHLAHEIGVALGVANALLRSLAKRGYIRISQVGWKRWVYVVTPAGITRKVHLTLGYIESFLEHYKRVRALLRHDLSGLTMSAESRVAVYGTTELAELVYLALQDLGLSKIEFFDSSGGCDWFMGSAVQRLDSIVPGDYLKVIIAFPGDVSARCQELRDCGIAPSQIVPLLQNAKDQAILTEARPRTYG